MATNKQPAKPTVLPDEEFNKQWDQEGLCKLIKRTSDPRFGDVSIMKHEKTNEIIFVKEKMATSKNEASNDIRELKSRIALNHPNLQKLVNYSTAVKKELCSTHYLSRGFYEFPRSDTQKELLERKRNLDGFSSSELTHLIYQILDGLHHLHSRNITHGDIRPLNIGYHKAANHFQILDRLADPSPLEKLQASNIVNKKELFICPELWKKLQGKDKTLKYSAYSNDLYALGLTVLHLGTSDSVQDIYKPNGEFNQQRLDQHIGDFNNKYNAENPYLCNIVQTLLNAKEEDRLDSAKLTQGLIPYDQFSMQERQGVKPQVAVHNEPQAQPAQTQPPVQNNSSDFFGTPAQHPYVYAEPSYDKVVVNRSELEQNKTQGNYSNVNTTQDYTNGSYNYGQPSYSYVVQNQAPVTYTYPTTQVQTTAPSYSYAPTTYTYSQPTYNYGNEPVTYVQSDPLNFAQPVNTVYYQAEPNTYVQSGTNTTFVNANIERPKEQSNSYTAYTVPAERKSYTQYVTGIDGVKTIRRSYVNYVTQPETTTVTQPTTYVSTNPVVTRRSYRVNQSSVYTNTNPIVTRKSYTAQATPGTTYVQSSPVTYVQGTPSYTYSQPVNVVYSNYTPITTTVNDRKVSSVNVEDGKHVIYHTSEPQYVYTPVTEGNRVYSYANPVTTYVSSEPTGGVEIRRGSSVPSENQTKVIKKRYILRGDEVVEVDAEDNEIHA